MLTAWRFPPNLTTGFAASCHFQPDDFMHAQMTSCTHR